ncbi:MAG: DoxX family protein [Rhodospirillaceae bacterium]|jgi:putative oxidoreductase|nr:DoxX family protein [Rhodospirillaceae bacterium]
MTNIKSISYVIKFNSLMAPIGRIFIAGIFFMAGLNKISSYENTVGFMNSAGVSGDLLPIVIALEIFGGVAVIVGWKTRIFAFLLAGFCLLSAILFHADFSNQIQMGMFMKNIAIVGGFLVLVANGGGSYSLDKRR